MKNNEYCRKHGACFRCEHGRFRSLLRGNVMARCKIQCFVKYARIPRIAVGYSVNIINRKLIPSLYRNNVTLRESPHDKLQIPAKPDFKGASC